MNSPFKEKIGSSGSSAPERQQSPEQMTLEAGDNATEQAAKNAASEAQTAAQKAAIVKANTAAIQQKERFDNFMSVWGDLETLDWKNIKPHKMALLLVAIPRRGKKDEPDYYLTYDQALIFAIEAYRMDLSPLSNQCFFVRETWKVNATFEGKKSMARKEGFMFGPPRFERITKPFLPNKRVTGFTEDIGYRCTMEMKGFTTPAEYTAWLSEFYVSMNPNWREKPEHMLQVRSAEKCISFASGAGASEQPHDNDIESPITGAPKVENFIPSFTENKV